jgi:hypothetical protein
MKNKRPKKKKTKKKANEKRKQGNTFITRSRLRRGKNASADGRTVLREPQLSDDRIDLTGELPIVIALAVGREPSFLFAFLRAQQWREDTRGTRTGASSPPPPTIPRPSRNAGGVPIVFPEMLFLGLPPLLPHLRPHTHHFVGPSDSPMISRYS